MRLHKIIFIFCIMLSAVMFANGIYVLGYFGPNHSSEPVKDLSQPEKIHFESSISRDQPVNLLVLGLDEEELRSDVILLFNYSPEDSKLNVLSIARDTRVFARGRYSKINALYSAGKESLVAWEVQQITGLTVHYYMTFNFKGFREAIDTLGGVEFRVPFRMNYDDPEQDLHIHLKKGLQLLDGDKAEQLVRYRKGNRAGQGYIDGDIGRIEMQQDFIKELIKQKMNLRYLSKAADIYEILSKYVKTNIKTADVTQYITSFKSVKADEIKTFTLPGDSAVKHDAWYYIYDEEKTHKIIQNNFYK